MKKNKIPTVSKCLLLSLLAFLFLNCSSPGNKNHETTADSPAVATTAKDSSTPASLISNPADADSAAEAGGVSEKSKIKGALVNKTVSLKRQDSIVYQKDVSFLKTYLLKKGLFFGTFLNVQDINLLPPRKPDFLDIVSKYFNFYTMSATYSVVEGRGKGIFNFASSDKTVEFALAHNAKVKGHVLVAGNALPKWLTDGNFTPDELKAILKNHVQTIVRHFKDKYPGAVTEWNVVNEAACNGGVMAGMGKNCLPEGIKKNIWTDIHKPGSTDNTDYIQYAFEWAHEIDPSAKLYLNENNIEEVSTPKKDRVYNLVKSLIKNKVPIDGVGFESHIRLYERNNYTVESLTAELNKYAALGLETQISEFDVIVAKGNMRGNADEANIQLPIDNPTSSDFDQQDKLYKIFMTAALKAKSCKAFTVWGASDGASWTNTHWKGSFYPHILDADMKPKLTFKTLIDVAKDNSIGH